MRSTMKIFCFKWFSVVFFQTQLEILELLFFFYFRKYLI